jgi:hypothetical protein
MQQRALADPRLAADHQSRALAGPGVGEDLLDHRALPIAAEQLRCAGPRAEGPAHRANAGADGMVVRWASGN